MDAAESIQGPSIKGDIVDTNGQEGSLITLLESAAPQCYLPDSAKQSCLEGMRRMDSDHAMDDEIMDSDQAMGDQIMVSGQSADQQVMVNLSDRGTDDQTPFSGMSVEDQVIISGQSIVKQTTTSDQGTGNEAIVSAQSAPDPSSRLGAAAAADTVPEAANLSPEARDLSDAAGDTSQQPENVVTDRSALCYSGEPKILTSVTTPFSANNFTKGCKW